MGLTYFPYGISFFRKGKDLTTVGLSRNIWYDCPLMQMAVEPGIGWFEWDDFTVFDSGGSFYAFYGTGGTSAAVTASPGGVISLATGTTANNDRYMTTNKNTAGLIQAGTDSTWWLEARLRLNTATSTQGAFFGLTKEAGMAADWMADSTMVPSTQNLIGFNVLCTAGSAVWRTIYCKDGGTLTVVNSNVLSVTADSWVRLGMKCSGGVVTFYVNGTADSNTLSTSATNYPANAVLQVSFGIKTGDTTNRTMQVDWWYGAQRRS